jgi:hypothetical protein
LKAIVLDYGAGLMLPDFSADVNARLAAMSGAVV